MRETERKVARKILSRFYGNFMFTKFSERFFLTSERRRKFFSFSRFSLSVAIFRSSFSHAHFFCSFFTVFLWKLFVFLLFFGFGKKWKLKVEKEESWNSWMTINQKFSQRAEKNCPSHLFSIDFSFLFARSTQAENFSVISLRFILFFFFDKKALKFVAVSQVPWMVSVKLEKLRKWNFCCNRSQKRKKSK